MEGVSGCGFLRSGMGHVGFYCEFGLVGEVGCAAEVGGDGVFSCRVGLEVKRGRGGDVQDLVDLVSAFPYSGAVNGDETELVFGV